MDGLRSRLVLLAKMTDATAASALSGFAAKLNSIAAPLRQSLTYDQGKEMAHHAQLSAATGMRCTSAIRTVHGSAGPARTPTDCGASTFPRAWICRATRNGTWMATPICSIPEHGKP